MGIYGYDRTYRTARTMLALIEVIGWLVVIGGFGLAVYGYFTGGASKLFNGDPAVPVRMLAALPGLGTALGGIFQRPSWIILTAASSRGKASQVP